MRKKRITKLDTKREYAFAKETQARNKAIFDKSHFGGLLQEIKNKTKPFK